MLTKTEVAADRDAYDGRTAILGFKAGRKTSRFILRALQVVGLYPKA